MVSADAVVLDTLAEKIERQAQTLAQLHDELQQARQASVHAMLGQLRLREAVLLYVGSDPAQFREQIAEAFGPEVARTVSSSLFVLDHAPVAPEVREALRDATDHGMNRWSGAPRPALPVLSSPAMGPHELREARAVAIHQAAMSAWRGYLAGPGAGLRRALFLARVLLTAAACMAVVLALCAWAVVGGLLVGPDHGSFLGQLQAWMAATPLDQVAAQGQAWLVDVLWTFAPTSLLLGLILQLQALAKPAAAQVKQRFETAVA